MDAHKSHVANQNKKRQLQQSMAQQLDTMDKDYENRKKLDLDNISGIGRQDSMTTLNVNAMELTSDVDEPLDDPDLYFGEPAVDKFWEFYKSERKDQA